MIVVAGTWDVFSSLNADFRYTYASGIKDADGKLRHYSPGTIEKWYLSYKHSEFEGLVPTDRFITGIDLFFNDNFVNLMSVMQSAVAKYGKSNVFNFDNGALG